MYFRASATVKQSLCSQFCNEGSYWTTGPHGGTVNHLISNNANCCSSLLGPDHAPRFNPDNHPDTLHVTDGMPTNHTGSRSRWRENFQKILTTGISTCSARFKESPDDGLFSEALL